MKVFYAQMLAQIYNVNKLLATKKPTNSRWMRMKSDRIRYRSIAITFDQKKGVAYMTDQFNFEHKQPANLKFSDHINSYFNEGKARITTNVNLKLET